MYVTVVCCIHCLTKLLFLLQPRNFSYCICMISLESYQYATPATNSQCKSGFATRVDMHHTLQNTQYGTCYGICFPSGSLVGSEDLATDSILYSSSAEMRRSPFLLTEQRKCLERRSQCLCIAMRKYWTSKTKANMSNGTLMFSLALNSNHTQRFYGLVSQLKSKACSKMGEPFHGQVLNLTYGKGQCQRQIKIPPAARTTREIGWLNSARIAMRKPMT